MAVKVWNGVPMTPNHALHWTFYQRRFACWFRASEGSRYIAFAQSSYIVSYSADYTTDKGTRSVPTVLFY